MENEELNKIQEEIDGILKNSNIPPDEIAKFNEKLLKLQKEKDRKLVAAEVLNKLFKPVVDEKKLIEAIEKIELPAPIVNVEAPIIPDPKVIVKNIPPPIVEVKTQKIVMQEKKVIFPKETKVVGLTGFIKTVLDILKSDIKVSLEGISITNPLPVKLIFDGKSYKAEGGGGGGGGPSRVYIKNGLGQTTSPASEGHETFGSGKKTITTAGTRVQLPDIKCKVVIVQANQNNTGQITVGGSNVVGTPIAVRVGNYLYKTWKTDPIRVANLNQIWLDATVDGEGATYIYEN